MIGNGGSPAVSRQESLWQAGRSFSTVDYYIFGAAEVKTFVFDPTACGCANIEFEAIVFASTSGPILIDFFAGVDADDDGTLINLSNRKASTGILPESILRLAPIINDIGTKFSGDLVPASGIAPANSTGALSGGGLPFEIADKSLKYAFRLTNQDGAGTTVKVDLTFYEF